jgi:acyl-homoserine-lactone acylase
MAVLEAWDRTADADSRGAVLFFRWFNDLRQASDRATDDPFGPLWTEGWAGLSGPDDAERAMATPDGLADPEGAVAILAEAARKVEEDHGALDVAWGDVFRFRVGGRDLPANGAPGQLGVFRVVYYGAFGGDPPSRPALGGDSFIAAVELSDPPRARTVIPYGNASQPGSPHAGDQIEIFAAKELRPVWRELDEIEEHLERREVVAPEGGDR